MIWKQCRHRIHQIKTLCLCLATLACALPAQADIDCDGVDDTLTTVDIMSSFLSTTAWTISLYVKSTGSDYAGVAWYEGSAYLADAGTNLMLIGRGNTDGELFFVHVEGSVSDLEVALTPGWHHVAVRQSAGTLAVFRDGVSVTSTSISDLSSGNLGATLEMCGSSGLHSEDRFTEVKIYNVAVSDDELGRLGRNKLRGYDRTTPTGYWPLTDCANGASANGVALQDRSGAARDFSGDDGGNDTGVTCRASEWVSRPMGVQ